MKLLEHTAECDNAYQTYKECVCHVAQAKILIDALEEIKKEFKWTHSNGVCAACIAIKALKEIGYESQ